MVGEVLFHPILLWKVQTHFRNMGSCAISMDDQLLIGSTDLSFAPFPQWHKYMGNGIVGVEFDPL
jgi:hypothetical protein